MSEVIQTLTKYVTIPLEYLPRDCPLPYSLFIIIDDKVLLFRNAGDTLTSDRAKTLEQKGAVSLQVLKSQLHTYVSEVEKELSVLSEDRSDESSSISVKNLIFAYTRVFEDSGTVDSDIFKKLEKMVGRLAAAIKNDVALAAKLLRRYRDPTLFFPNHALTTCIFSTAIGIKHGLAGKELTELAVAGCLANVGLVKVDKSILYKPSKLTTEEWKVIQRHPIDGERMLSALLAPPRVVQAVGQHHERYDGNGYPKGLKGEQISFMARIIAIAEKFSELTSTKPWGAAIPGDQAIRLMRENAAGFDPKLLSMSMG